MHQKQHTHEFDVDLHTGRPDVDSEQRDAGIFTATHNILCNPQTFKNVI